jgi:opacity protein-like surface antigen
MLLLCIKIKQGYTMKKTLLSITAVAVMSVSAFAGKNYIPAVVEPIPVPVAEIPLGLYLGGGFTYAHSECQCDDSIEFSNGTGSKVNKANTYGYNLKAGYTINEFLAVEAKYINTPWGDDDKSLKHYGLYLKPTYAVSENLDIYALLGYGKTECETLQDTQKGFAWGAGAEYTFDKRVEGLKSGFGVYVEYLRPLKKTGNKDITVDMVNTGVSYHF